MAKTAEWMERNRAFNERFSEFYGKRLSEAGISPIRAAGDAGVSVATAYGYRAGKTPALHESLRLLRATGIETLNLAELLD